MISNMDELTSKLLLTREDVVVLLSVPPETIVNLHRTHQLRGVRVGKHVRWLPKDVQRFVDGLEAEA